MAQNADGLWGYAGGYGGWNAYGGDSYGRQYWNWRYRRLGFWLTQHECARPQDPNAAMPGLSATAEAGRAEALKVAVTMAAKTYSFRA